MIVMDRNVIVGVHVKKPLQSQHANDSKNKHSCGLLSPRKPTAAAAAVATHSPCWSAFA
jgi:hypothetical protein